MIRCFCLILAISLFSHISSAQSFRLGVKGGLNFDKVNFSFDENSGYHAGGFITVKFSKLAIQPEVLFSKEDARFEIDNSDFDANYSFISIPVMVKLYLIGGLNLQAGPELKLLKKAKYYSSGSDDDITEELKESELGLSVGLGWDLPLRLTASARYTVNLSKPDEYLLGSEEGQNQLFRLSLGYRLFQSEE